MWTALPERRPLILRGGAPVRACVRAYVRACVRACGVRFESDGMSATKSTPAGPATRRASVGRESSGGGGRIPGRHPWRAARCGQRSPRARPAGG